MPPNESLGQSKLLTQRAHFVFEQFAHRLDQLHIHPLGQTTDIMVALNRHAWPAGEGNALNDIRVKRALRQKIRAAHCIGFFFKHVDESAADNFTLFLGVGDAIQLTEKQIRCILMHQLDIEMVAEQANDLLAFTGAHHAGIDIDAGQLLTNRLVQQYGDNRTVNAARQAANHPTFADLCANIGNRLIAKRRHAPIAFATGNLMGEVFQHFGAVRRMHHFRMKLHAVNFLRFIGDRRIGRVFRRADDGEAVRQLIDAVAMAHPHLNGVAVNAVKQRRGSFDIQHGAAKLAFVRLLNRTAQLRAQRLLAVTNPQNRQTRTQDIFRRARRIYIGHRIGAAR